MSVFTRQIQLQYIQTHKERHTQKRREIHQMEFWTMSLFLSRILVRKHYFAVNGWDLNIKHLFKMKFG